MPPFFKKKPQKFSQMHFEAFKNGRFSFSCLNIAQFLGALNDNIYKLLTVFLLISTLGIQSASGVLSAVGALYVIPFLLFSSAAGILADRLSKQKLIFSLKICEIFIMTLALLAFFYKSVWGSYTLLFLLATHSAVFGPSKYGIIPELVDKNQVAKANSQITAFTYLAIITGTFLASFLTDSTGQNYVFSVSFCLFFSLIGLLASLGIKKTTPQKSIKKIHLFFLQEILQTVSECRKIPLLAPSLFGSAYFLFIGAFTQLNIIPFAIESLKLSEYAGGYLFLLTALGIAGGSLLAGKLLKKKVELGLSCLAGFAIGALFFLLWAFSTLLIPVIIILTLLGVAGGVFVISFDSFIQLNSPVEKRGQTIAAANFFSFFGILIASFCLYLFGYLMGFSPALSFLCMGFLTVIAVFCLTLRLLETAFPFFGRLFSLKKSDPKNLIAESSFFIVEESSWKATWKIASLTSFCFLIFVGKKKRGLFFLLSLAPNVLFLPAQMPFEEILKKSKGLLHKERKICIFFNRKLKPEEKQKRKIIPFQKENSCFIYLDNNEIKTE